MSDSKSLIKRAKTTKENINGFASGGYRTSLPGLCDILGLRSFSLDEMTNPFSMYYLHHRGACMDNFVDLLNKRNRFLWTKSSYQSTMNSKATINRSLKKRGVLIDERFSI